MMTSTKEFMQSYEAMQSLIWASNPVRLLYDLDAWLEVCKSTIERIPFYLLSYGSIGSVDFGVLTDRK